MPVTRRKLAVVAVPNPQTCSCAKRGYNIHAAAAYLGVSKWQVRRWKKDGVLTSAKVGKADHFDKVILDLFMDKMFGVAA